MVHASNNLQLPYPIFRTYISAETVLIAVTAYQNKKKIISSESTRIPLPKDSVICEPKNYFEMFVYFEDTKTIHS